MDELKPCPSCESSRVESCADDHGDRTVCCQVCGMCGPTFGAGGPMFGMSGQTLAEMLADEDAARLKAEAAWNALPRHAEPAAQGSVVQALAELREAGGKAWDDVPDVEAELGRKPEPPTLVWSSERPKVEGWYFVRNVPGRVTSNIWWIDEDEMNTQWVESVEFAGPIPEPKEAAK